jgi:4-aminobutyrate aminotransferase-like enzyme
VNEFERLATEVPGPRSRELAERLRTCESRGVTYLSEDAPIFWASAAGATVTDVDGNRYIDLTAAFGVATTGHANPAVVEAMATQAARLPHGMGDVHPPEMKVLLLERLAALAPVDDPRAFLCTSGGESVEFALKTALLATGRPNVLAFEGSYHGLAHGALEATGIGRFREPFLAQLRGATRFVPYPDRRDPSALERTLTAIGLAFRDDGSLGAVIVEPIQGRGGIVVPPAGFLSGLRAVCDAHERLLIVDEIYTGLGRTGALFASMREQVSPDLLCLGKALAGGFPIAATVGRRTVMDAWPASTGEALHTSTYLGNPMGCAAALANLSEIERLEIPRRARLLAQRFEERLGAVARAHAWVRDVRGAGALWGIECDTDVRATEWVTRALRRGIIALQSGARGTTIALSPPVVISAGQADRALDLLIESAPA